MFAVLDGLGNLTATAIEAECDDFHNRESTARRSQLGAPLDLNLPQNNGLDDGNEIHCQRLDICREKVATPSAQGQTGPAHTQTWRRMQRSRRHTCGQMHVQFLKTASTRKDPRLTIHCPRN